jgi:alpha-methylacyl-CoA racemase
MAARGPLCGIRIVEIEGVGGAPFAGMLLADMGADIIRVERPGADGVAIGGADPGPVFGRGRAATLYLDLKDPTGLTLLLDLLDRADASIEAFRPGVAERLGFGPDVALARNPRLVYGRLTGWGREGPLAARAGHDINYIALSGLLAAIGRRESPPSPPLAVGGDMTGGFLLAFGMVAALFERASSGQGQVVDAAMLDSAALTIGGFAGYVATGGWSPERETNLTDGGAPFYDAYQCADGRFIALGALEPKFQAILLDRLGLHDLPSWNDPANWPACKARLADHFRTRNSAAWRTLLEDTDACFAPVLNFGEAPDHPHNRARGTFTILDGITQPAAGPRLSRTPGAARRRGSNLSDALNRWGLDPGSGPSPRSG